MGRRAAAVASPAPTAASSAKKRSSKKSKSSAVDEFDFDLTDDAPTSSGSHKKKPSTPLLSAKKLKAIAKAREEADTPTASRKQTKTAAARSSTGSAAAEAATPTPKARGRPRSTSAHSPAIPAAASPSSVLFTPSRRPIIERAVPTSSVSVVSSRSSGLHSLSERASTPPRFGSEEKAAAAAATKAAAKAAAAKPAAAQRPSVTPTARRSQGPAAAACASRGSDSRSSTPPSEHDRSAWASMLATADLGSIVAAPIGAMDALHSWEAQSAGTKGSPTKKRRASPKRVEKRTGDEMEVEEEKENMPQSPAKKARKSPSVKKVVREGGRRSTRHADEPRKSLKEPSDEEEEEEERSEQEDEEEEEEQARPAKAASKAASKAAKSAMVDEYDVEALDDTRSHASAASGSRRARHVHRPSTFVDVKLSQAEQEKMDKTRAFFADLDKTSIEDIFEVVRR